MNRDGGIEILLNGGIGVLPTDTLYGIVGSAWSKKTVERIYILRRRNLKKPMIILIDSMNDLARFGVRPSLQVKKILKKLWPGKVSIVLPISRRGNFLTQFSYLHRGTGTLAFRLPAPKKLKTKSRQLFDLGKFLKKTGPLVAPSANFEGEVPAKTIRAAEKYFGANVDFYLNAGPRHSEPSTLITIDHGKVIVLRMGAVRIN